MRLPLVLTLAALLTGCGLGFRTIPVPTDLKPLNGVQYYDWCTDINNAECHLFYVGTKPISLTTWSEPAIPFGTVRYAEWMGDYPFWSRVWFPFGLPDQPGEHCGVQVYGGIKVEGTVHREMQKLFALTGYPLEFKPSEQHALRVKCDLEVVPDIDNMAGY